MYNCMKCQLGTELTQTHSQAPFVLFNNIFGVYQITHCRHKDNAQTDLGQTNERGHCIEKLAKQKSCNRKGIIGAELL